MLIMAKGEENSPLLEPNVKECTESVGPCSVKCNDLCCDKKCVDKFPLQAGRGNCSELIPNSNNCICTFRC